MVSLNRQRLISKVCAAGKLPANAFGRRGPEVRTEARLRQKRSLKHLVNRMSDRLLSARSGHSLRALILDRKIRQCLSSVL